MLFRYEFHYELQLIVAFDENFMLCGDVNKCLLHIFDTNVQLSFAVINFFFWKKSKFLNLSKTIEILVVI